MTILTSVTKLASWGVAEAKSHFSDLIERAVADGPQVITRHGRQAVVVVSAEEWARKTRRKESLAEFFASSPLRRSGLEIERRPDGPRDITL